MTAMPAEEPKPAPSAQSASPEASQKPAAIPTRKRRRKFILVGVLLAIAVLVIGVPRILHALNTVSTDDAYVNGHVTFVAPRVAGQVARVLADDNYRVKKGDLLVELDKEPYQVQVAIKTAAVEAADADLAAAEAQAHGVAAQARSNRFNLEHAIESVRNQLATLRSNVAQMQVEQANLQLAERDYARNQPLVGRG